MLRSGPVRSSRRRGSTESRALPAVPALLLVLVGCAAPAADVAEPPATPTATAPLRTSGPLTDGFEVEPGSGLVGVVFPLSEGDGWQAVLRVEEDGERVFDRYVRQAEALGQELQSQWCCRPPEQWCSDPEDEWPDDEPPAPFRTGCFAHTAFEDEVLDEEEPFPVVGLRGFFGADGAGWIHLGGSLVFAENPPWAPVADGPAAPATDADIAPDLTPEYETPVRVVEGSTLVSEPFPSECLTGGYIAVLQVDADLPQVMRGFGGQFDADGFGPTDLEGYEGDLRVAGGGGGSGIISAVGVAGDPSHVLVERCND